MTVQDLIQRATGGRQLDRQVLFRPSLVYRVLRDPFWVWCEYHAPRSEAVDETSRYDEMRWQRGIEYEQGWVREHYPDAVRVTPDFGFEALRNTLRAMVEGVAAIYQPQLWDLQGESYGKADLLVRDDTRGSDLGPYHYRLVEIKRAKSVQDHHVLQAACYNRMLGRLQGWTPAEMTVALRDAIERASYSQRENELKEIVGKWRALRDGRVIPEPGRPPDVTASPWRIYGNTLVEQRRDLVLLAGVAPRERGRLREAGVQRVDQLWNLDLEEICAILGRQYGMQAYSVAQAYKSGEPVLKPGCRLVIPRAKRHLYFDFETSDEVHPTEPPHVYLIGCWDAEGNRFVNFLARGAEEEEAIFSDFLQYVGRGEETRLYHWTDYEIGQMMRVAQRWPSLEAPLRRLMSSCVDLMPAIKSAVYLPVPSFSLKCVAPALGFRWRQKDFDAFDSMICYWDYLDGRDESGIQRALAYNEDDCRAMWYVDHELTKRLTGRKES
ncbi:MAG: TM0106 family RecB-like putative nuclease [Candidatus Methylomirabilales bacterium]